MNLAVARLYSRRVAFVKYAIALMAACTMAAAFVTTTAARQPSRASASGPATERHKAVSSNTARAAIAPVSRRLALLWTLDIENAPAHAETWEKVVRKLRTGAMPPAGMPRPDEAAYDALASSLEARARRRGWRAPNRSARRCAA